MDDKGTRNTFRGSADIVIQGRDIQGGLHFHRQAKAAPIPHQLPPRRKGFTGRATQIDALVRMLSPDAGGDAVVVSAVAGLAGVGKTALAIEAAHIAVDYGWFGGGELFLDLRGYGAEPITAEQALGDLLAGLGVPESDIRQGAEARATQFRTVLANWQEPVLVLADNASSAAQVRPLLPGDRRHRVLITSRHTLPQLDARLLDLGVLSPAESIQLMRVALHNRNPQDTRFADEPAAAEDVARLCGYLPLALQIATALLAATGRMPVAELAGELADVLQRLDRLNDQENAVRAAFDLSYRRLSPDEARLFRLTSLNPGPDFSSDTAAALVATDEPVARRILYELARAHLVEPGEIHLRWRMHDLIRDYAGQAALADEDLADYRDARDRMLDHYLCQANVADERWHGVIDMDTPAAKTTQAWFDAEWPNLRAAVELAATCRDTVARDLPVALGRYLFGPLKFHDKLAMDIIRRDAALRLGDRAGLAAAVDAVGFDLNNVSRFEEAATTLEHAAALFQELGDQRGEGEALHHLGTTLRGLRRLDEAIAACRRAAELLPDAVGSHGPHDNLAMCLLAAGRKAEAIEIWDRITPADPMWQSHPWSRLSYTQIWLDTERLNRLRLELRRAKDAGDRRGEAKALLGLGELRFVPQRHFDDVMDAAEIFRDLGDRAKQSEALVVAGRMLRDNRRPGEAIPILNQAIAISREAGDLPSEGKALTELFWSLGYEKRLTEAADAIEQAAAIFHRVDDRPAECEARMNLGRIRAELGLYAESIAPSRRALDLSRVTGQRSLEAVSLLNLGFALLQTKQFEESVAVNHEAVELSRAIREPREECIALRNLGSALLGLRLYPESIEANRQALAVMDDSDPAGRAHTLSNLALALVHTGQHADGIDSYRQSVATYRELGDATSEALIQIDLGTALLGLNRHEEALEVSLQAAAHFSEIGNRDYEHRAMADAIQSLAVLAQSEAGLAILRKNVTICRAAGYAEGESMTMLLLGAGLTDLGLRDEAISVNQQAAELFRTAGDHDGVALALDHLRKALLL